MKQKKGFTLIELIVVIAILGILALFLVPSFIGYAEDSKEAVCNSNLTSINRAYQFQLAKQESDEDKQILIKVMNNEFNDFSVIPSCPSGGTYYIIDDGSDGVSVFKAACSEHSNILGRIPTQIINQMDYFTKTVKELDINSDEFKKYYDLYIESGGKEKIDKFQSYVLKNNSELRKYLKYVNGGTWPTMKVNGQELYVQPYLDSSTSNHTPSYDTIIYASANDGNNWNTSYIYNSDTGKWWTGKSFSIANKSMATIQNDMQKNGWKEVENPDEIVISGSIVMP